MQLLCGDIGGTKTRLALLQPEGQRLQTLHQHDYPSADATSLEQLVRDFIDRFEVSADAAAFGVAGPVTGRRCRTTNLSWQIDADLLRQRLGLLRVELLNDLQATAWGIDALGSDDFCTLQKGEPDAAGNRAVIAAGTGLGEAGLYRDASGYRPFATEGGHTDFAPTDDLQWALASSLRRRYGQVSWERLVSGPGLVDIHAFLLAHHGVPSPGWLSAGTEPAAAISGAADQDPIARQAVLLFVRLYGSEAGNLALKHLATGGLYIGGGIAPKLLDWLRAPAFLEAFNDKGKMAPLMRRIPVTVILNDRTALLGPARYLVQLLTD